MPSFSIASGSSTSTSTPSASSFCASLGELDRTERVGRLVDQLAGEDRALDRRAAAGDARRRPCALSATWSVTVSGARRRRRPSSSPCTCRSGSGGAAARPRVRRPPPGVASGSSMTMAAFSARKPASFAASEPPRSVQAVSATVFAPALPLPRTTSRCAVESGRRDEVEHLPLLALEARGVAHALPVEPGRRPDRRRRPLRRRALGGINDENAGRPWAAADAVLMVRALGIARGRPVRRGGSGASNSRFARRVNPATGGVKSPCATARSGPSPCHCHGTPLRVFAGGGGFRRKSTGDSRTSLMSRLSPYLTKLFVFEAVALTSVVVFLLYLVQSLRMFDLVSAKGQDLLTLAGQAALVMPAVAVIFLYVCIGIGLAPGAPRAAAQPPARSSSTRPRGSRRCSAASPIYTGIFTLARALARPHLRAARRSAALRVVGEHRGRSRQPRAPAAPVCRDRAGRDDRHRRAPGHRADHRLLRRRPARSRAPPDLHRERGADHADRRRLRPSAHRRRDPLSRRQAAASPRSRSTATTCR